MRLLLFCLLTVSLLIGQQKGRVFLISLDGLGHEAFLSDPAATELKALRRLAEEGIHAPMQAAFPSQTAPGHASIFTGVYGNVNGVTANLVPLDFNKSASGFRAEQLRAETFWVKAGRGGVRSVAHNPTQGFPCNQFNSGQNAVLVNGYQTGEVAPQTLLHGRDVEWLDARLSTFVDVPASRQPVKYFRYSSGRIRFSGAVFAKGLRYDTIRLTAENGKRYVDATLRQAEQEPVRSGASGARALARYFSESLPIANVAAVHFRLFELSSSGMDFLLYQTEAKEISVCLNGPGQAERFKERMLSTSGAFIGNGSKFYESGGFGKRNTDGLAERRWLETLELHARQTMRHTRSLLAEFSPQLFVDYISTPDDMLHSWWGLARGGSLSNEPFRRWGYQIIDWRIDQLRQLLKQEDHFVIVSDHGMTAVDREVRVRTLLQEYGYGDRITAGAYFLRLKDRADKPLLLEAQRRLSAIETGGVPVFTSWYWPSEASQKFGIGGEYGGDLYFDLAPGFTLSLEAKEPWLVKLQSSRGVHGPLPTRPDLMALFIAHGPEIQSRAVSMRTVDVAPLVLKLLGL